MTGASVNLALTVEPVITTVYNIPVALTARDKVTRVQHLGSLSVQGRQSHEPPRFQVIACIAGRGFKDRLEDRKKLLLSTRGKVFTLTNLDRLVECSRLAEYKSR